jgi:riboflavin kinase/FMN adenylyltransferase
MSQEYFFTDILIKRLDAKVLYLGHDFAMGRDRSGSVSKLRQIAQAHGVEVHELEPLMLDQAPVSSSRIRKALELGDLLEANRNLGRPFFVRGIVGKGAGRGKTIGFPTANLLLSKRILPRRGVYITQIQWKNRTYSAVTNLGRNPTFTGDGNQIPYMLESHIFDFSESLYGETLQVDFLKFLRDEQRFSGVAALVEQIKLDCVAAREFFSLNQAVE